MNTARTFITALAVSMTLGAGLVPADREPVTARAASSNQAVVEPEVPVEPSVPTVVAADNDHELLQLGQWAIDRFETAALSVPAIEIHLHRTSEGCGGHRGTFDPTANRIDACVAEPLVLLHELAHAWAHENLTPHQREAFVAAGGFESWNAHETAWADRGSERAADVIAWGLLEEPQMMFTEDGPIAGANAQFRMLTGFDAPRIVHP